MRWITALLFALSGPAWAEGEPAGDFDYYVLSLSWSPTWCALEGDRRNADQCDARHDHGWTLHGLWPQYENGWPSFCRTVARDPSRAMTGAMVDVMGSSGLAWHQWRKHGRCSGLEAEAYFSAAREAYDAVTRPEVLRRLGRPVEISAAVIEAAFLRDNPELTAKGLTVTCKVGRIQEVRVCLTKDLEPRDCTGSVARDCTLEDALFAPVR
jgi:ribonuclease T2